MVSGIDGQRDGTGAHPQVLALKNEWNNLLGSPKAEDHRLPPNAHIR